jgi:hypothetical protein
MKCIYLICDVSKIMVEWVKGIEKGALDALIEHQHAWLPLGMETLTDSFFDGTFHSASYKAEIHIWTFVPGQPENFPCT